MTILENAEVTDLNILENAEVTDLNILENAEGIDLKIPKNAKVTNLNILENTKVTDLKSSVIKKWKVTYRRLKDRLDDPEDHIEIETDVVVLAAGSWCSYLGITIWILNMIHIPYARSY